MGACERRVLDGRIVRDPVIQLNVIDVRYCEKATFEADFALR